LIDIGIRVALAFAALFAIGADSLGQEAMQTFRGLYVNVDYGFSVEIPDGLIGKGAPTHAPNHGFTINLNPKSAVWVDATYDMPDSPHTFGRFNTRLGTLKAELKSWKTTGQGSESLYRAIVARGFDRGTPIIYTIQLETTPAYREESFRVFESVLNSFRIIPVRP
jgi:hypothetical protein